MKTYKKDQAYVWHYVQMLTEGKCTDDNFLFAYYEKPDKILFISEERILCIYDQVILWELKTSSLKLVERDDDRLILYYGKGQREFILKTEEKAIEVYQKLSQIIS